MNRSGFTPQSHHSLASQTKIWEAVKHLTDQKVLSDYELKAGKECKEFNLVRLHAQRD